MFGDKTNKIKDSERSLISETVSIEWTINSSGAIDIAGLIKGPINSKEISIFWYFLYWVVVFYFLERFNY